MVPGDEAGKDHAHHGQRCAAQVIQSELGRAPFPLQGRADPVVKIQGDEQRKGAAVFWHKDVGHDPPHLSVQQSIQVEGQKIQRRGIHIPAEHRQHIYHHVADDNIAHQVGDAETGMAGAEALHRIV